MARGLLILLVTQVLLAPWTLAATTPDNIRIAAEDSWPPFADADGNGLSHRLVRSAFAQEGIKVNTLVVPYNRGLILTEQGKVNAVFNVARQQSTESRFLFGNEPLFQTTASFYQLKSRPPLAIDKWSLPAGTRVGIIRGYEYGDEFDRIPNLVLQVCDSQYQLLNLLLTHKLDMVIMYDEVAQQFLRRTGVESEVMATFPNHTSELFLAFSKTDADSASLITALDNGLRRLREQGEYKRLLAEIGITPHRH